MERRQPLNLLKRLCALLIKKSILLKILQEEEVDEEEEDPRRQLTDALLKYQQAKAAALVFAPMYAAYSGRMVKETDEISVDKTFVADQKVEDLCLAVRRIITYNEAMEKAKSKEPFTPMISKPIIPVEVKIVGILGHLEKTRHASLEELLMESTSLPDMIAIFIGVLELMKVNRIRMIEDDNGVPESLHNTATRFEINYDYKEPEKTSEDETTEDNA